MAESLIRGSRVGLAFGLLTASGVTVVGVVRNLAPEVILMRASVAGMGCGMLACVCLAILKRLESDIE